MAARVKPAHDGLLYDVAAELILYMDTDNIIESVFRGRETEFLGARRLKIPRRGSIIRNMLTQSSPQKMALTPAQEAELATFQENIQKLETAHGCSQQGSRPGRRASASM